MNDIPAFLTGLLVLTALTIAVLLFVQRPFTRVLVELCAGEHRARFWVRLYQIGIVLTVLFFALLSPPSARFDQPEPISFHELVSLYRAGLLGLLLSLAVLAFTTFVGIARYESRQRYSQPLPRLASGEPATPPA
jgi:hypothetical protein